MALWYIVYLSHITHLSNNLTNIAYGTLSGHMHFVSPHTYVIVEFSSSSAVLESVKSLIFISTMVKCALCRSVTKRLPLSRPTSLQKNCIMPTTYAYARNHTQCTFQSIMFDRVLDRTSCYAGWSCIS